MYTRDTSSAKSDRITISVNRAALDDLGYRLVHTRWPDEVANDSWAYGTNLTWLKELVAYWAIDFNWRAHEVWLNSFPHYKSKVDGLGIHYIHQHSDDPAAIPLLLLHGWPGSFVQMLKLLPMLTDPAAHGMPDAPAFHVVIASLPGFAFSDASPVPGMHMEAIAAILATLMHDVLGYETYGVRGSDLGGTTIDQMARHYPQQLIGVHLTQLIVGGPVAVPDDATAAERAFLEASARNGNTELAYARQHASKPQTLAYGLNDSPAGLAAWIVEKYRSWGDTGGNIESRFSKDFLLTTLSLYWFTETISPSIRLYYDMVRHRGSAARIDVPSGFLMSMKDLFPPAPREWAQRSHNVVHFSEAARGGHFLEWEEPELVARDLQVFFAGL